MSTFSSSLKENKDKLLPDVGLSSLTNTKQTEHSYKKMCWDQPKLLKANIAVEWNSGTKLLQVSWKNGHLTHRSAHLQCAARRPQQKHMISMLHHLFTKRWQTGVEGVRVVNVFTNEVTSGFRQDYVNDLSDRISMSTNLPVWPSLISLYPLLTKSLCQRVSLCWETDEGESRQTHTHTHTRTH